MFRLKPVIIFGLNFLLVIASWAGHLSPRGDEYLALFMIPIVFIAAPFIATLPVIIWLFGINFAIFVFFHFMGILNVIDITALMVLIGALTGGGFVVKELYTSFAMYYRFDISDRQRKYTAVVSELEGINRRGRKAENELSRISRLYEITKRLAPALKFKDLLDVLFDFLEENFRSEVTHLITIAGGTPPRGISKSIKGDNYYEDRDKVLNYGKIVEYAEKNDLKPFFIERSENKKFFSSMKIGADTFMAFPLFVGDKLSAILATEGSSKNNFSRFGILIPQVALELRKVELYEQVQKLSIIDGLTEVYLRRYLMTRLEEEVERAGRLNLRFSVAMIDVDNFKACNDTYGHLAGDMVLRKISERLKCSVREVDMVARYGGEEFCVVLPETTKRLALSVAERLRKTVGSNEIDANGKKIKTTISIGIATYPKDGTDVTGLLDKADTALYKAKRKGRNVVCGA
ncbi:MAG: GGDEF domain-containing protein [Candidatus Omnitrophica bacterium]|nr:GGDEF domain-containing protein [Candidatus Omnitrophota bacterium]